MNIGEILEYFADVASEEPLLLLAFLISFGSVLGAIKIKGIALGPSGVLFFALAVSAADPRLKLPSAVGVFGLVIFAYAIGNTSGPSFINSIKRGGPIITLVLASLAFLALFLTLVGGLLGVPDPILAGVFAGSLTNTPALATATQAFKTDDPTIGYSITYIFGVLGMLFYSTLALKTKLSEKKLATIETLEDEKPIADTMNIRVDVEDLPDFYTLSMEYEGDIVFSRIMKGDEPGKPGIVSLALDTVIPEKGDIITAVGPSPKLEELCEKIGHSSTVALTFDRSKLDSRRAVVSNPEISGSEIGNLRLDRRFGATITRVRRGDIDFVATSDFQLQLGDRVRIVAPRDNLNLVSDFFGDSEQRLSGFSMIGLGFGILAGVLLGILVIPIGGIELSIGLGGGALIAGLFLGSVQKTGKIIWSIPDSTAKVLTQLGIVMFLAYAGSNAGGTFIEAIGSEIGIKLLILGFITTNIFGLLLVFGGKIFGKIVGPKLAGIIAAGQTQPAVLAYASEKTEHNPDVKIGYALVYPAAMIGKVILAPLIGII